jgi:hypothetical protein
MAVETATIRVPRATRDLLAHQAHERGVSLAGLLSEIAREQQAAEMWRGERAASRADALNPDVAVEESEWEAVLADGVA